MPPRKVAAKSKPAGGNKKIEKVEENNEEQVENVSPENPVDVEMIPVELVQEKEEEVEVKEDDENDKTEDAETVEVVEVAEEVPAEIKDFEEDSRPRVKEVGKFGSVDSTLDTYFGESGLIGSNSTEGFQYLLSGARSNIGVKGKSGGVFAYEVKIVEILTPMDSACNRQAYIPHNKHCLRIGFSTIDGSVLLGNDNNGLAFDAGLGYDRSRGRPKAGARFANGPCVWKGTTTVYLDEAEFGMDDVVTVVLNLSEDLDDRHSQSIALFKNGVRVTEPIAIPENLIGKDLYPTVTFKNVRIAVNLGYMEESKKAAQVGGLCRKLPFKCRSIQQSAEEDICISPYFWEQPKEPEAVLIVGLPDQGVFDYVDYFTKENPYKYTEISDRTMFEWLKASSLCPLRRGAETSNDRPDYLFGIQPIDEGIVRARMRDFASFPQNGRSILLVEVKGGLLEKERANIMSKFLTRRRVARICVGEPEVGYQNYVKDLVRGEIMLEKSSEREVRLEELKREWRARVEEKERIKKVKVAARAAEKARKEAAAEARRKRKEAAMRAAAAKKAAEARKGEEGATEENPEGKMAGDDITMNEDEVVESEAESESKVEEEEEMEPEPTLPEVEVADDDLKKTMVGGFFRPQRLHDINPHSLSESYLSFTLPTLEESFEDGSGKVFDEILYDWEKKEQAESKLESWIRNRKVLEKVPSLTKASEWFEVQMSAWRETKLEWRKKHRAYQQGLAMREAVAKKAASDKPNKEGEENKEEGGEKNDTPEGSETPPEQQPAAHVDPEEADVWSVEDISDLDGKGTPLYGKFGAEDWQLLNLRYELHLLCHAFFRDVTSEDPDVCGIHRSLLQHYYHIYFGEGQQLHPSMYGGKSLDDLLDRLVVDTIIVGDDGVLKTVHDIDTPQSTFVRLVEAARRERNKRIEAGDESARITIREPSVVTAPRNSKGGRPTVRDNRHRGGKAGRPSMHSSGKGMPRQHQQQQQQQPVAHPNRYARSLPSSPASRGGYQGAVRPGVYQYQQQQHHSPLQGGYGGRYPAPPAGGGGGPPHYGGQQNYNAGYKRAYESGGMYEYEAGKRQKGGGPSYPSGQYYQSYGGQYYRQ